MAAPQFGILSSALAEYAILGSGRYPLLTALDIDNISGQASGTVVLAARLATRRLLVETLPSTGALTDVNILQYGGVPTTLGQKAMASSIPTVIANNQSRIPVHGSIAHDDPDSGNPVKIGGKSTDSDPSQGEGSQAPAEVAEADRVDAWMDRSGRIMAGVEPEWDTLDNIGTTYNNVTTTATSQAINCWMYRSCAIALELDKANTPTDILIEVETSLDGTNWTKYMNGPFGDWRYDDGAVATGLEENLVISDLTCMKIRVKVTATGTNATNTFTVTNPRIYFRN